MNESTQSSETSTTTEQPKADGPRESDTLDNFRKLLSEGESQEGEGGESREQPEPQEGKPKGKPKALKDLAERLELQPEDLYAIEIPLGGDGKTVKLSELKDTFAKQDDLTVRELALAEKAAKQEAEWTRSQTEFAELMSQLDPKAITPQVKEKVRQKVDASVKRERELILQTIPEWQNATVREAELGAMVEYLKDFGLPESFLTTTMHHKLFRMVRDATLRKQRHEKALSSVVQVKKPSTTGKSGASNGAPRKPTTSPPQRSGDMQERFRQILANDG